MMGALAEFERSLISERTRAGMEVARQAGKPIGRPRSLTPEQIDYARTAIAERSEDLDTLANLFNVHPRTLARALERKG
jgi:DNA invertase Pin-like site-specific DNA recombinase